MARNQTYVFQFYLRRSELFRIMRLIVMFDLPVNTSKQRRDYTRFRKFLIKNGYAMMQYSVYSKIILNHSVLNFQKDLLKQNVPPKGYVETLVITEKQYTNIEMIVGEGSRSPQMNKVERLIEL